MAINLVVLSGRLTADAELQKTPNGISVCSFDIAVDSGYGENKQTDFIKIVAWRNTAEFITRYFNKGSMIGVEGSIRTRKYTDKNGNNRTAFEVVANSVHFLESKKTGTQNDNLVEFAQKVDFAELDVDEDDLPF